MDNSIRYLNTDLDLRSTVDLGPLVFDLKAARKVGYLPTRGNGGGWWASLSMEKLDEPEKNIANMLSVIESLPAESRNIWDACFLREFNIGYVCKGEPWSFSQGLSAALIGRIAAVGASLRITLYPEPDELYEIPF